MHYAVIFRTPGGINTLMKPIFRSIDDAEEGVVEACNWLSEDGWVRTEEGSIFELSDGSSFVIYREI
jgi:hypothetical protein